MTAPSYVVYEGDGGTNTPRRPTTDDLGGLLLTDSVKYPPQPNEHLSCLDWKQMEQCLVRIARMTPVLQIVLVSTGGTPTVASVISANDNITTADITIGTPPVTGQYSVSLPTAKLPTRTRLPSIETVSCAVNDSSVHVNYQSTTAVYIQFVKPSDGTAITGVAGTYVLNVYGI